MTPAGWRRAAGDLGEVIVQAAAVTSELVGFGWVGGPDAPGTYPDLVRAVERSLATGEPLPVSDDNGDSVVYPYPEVNLALRFWHDVSHVLRRLDFTPPQELQLAQLQLQAVERAGLERGSLAWRMLRADLVGQVYLSAVGRRFPADQAVFVERCLSDGIEAAVLAELGDAVRPQRPNLRPGTLAAA